MEIKDLLEDLEENERRLILEEIFNIDRTSYYLGNFNLSGEEYKELKNLVEKRKEGYPLQYLIGKWWVYGLELFVEEGVLIPRFETEILIDRAVNLKKEFKKILDIGTGTGLIAIALAKEFKNAEIIGLDINPKAIDLAKKNARHHKVDNIKFIESDLFSNLKEKDFDLIISNPPYIDKNLKKSLQKELTYEDDRALYSGSSGLDLIRKIIIESRDLSKEFNLLLEIGYDQGESVKNLLSKALYKNIEITKDLNNFDRVAEGYYTYLLNLFISFFKIGLFSFGGGYAMIPMIKTEVVQINSWLTNSEFIDMIAVSQMTPGPIAINLATYIGFQVNGPLGAVVSTLAVILPSFIIMTIIYLLVSKLKGSKYMDWFFTGLRPVIAGLIVSAILMVLPSSIVDIKTFIIFALSFVLVHFKKIHPIFVIIIAAGLGGIIYGW